MSLGSLLQASGKQATQNCHYANKLALRQRLRDLLFECMPSGKIAQLLADDPACARREVEAILEQCAAKECGAMSAHERVRLCREVSDMVCGFGPLEDLLADPSVTEVMVNAPDKVFFERGGVIHPCNVSFYDEQQVRMVIDRIVGPIGRRVDEQSPLVSARLPKGHRVNVVIPPLSLSGSVLTIRKFREHVFTLPELIKAGTLSPEIARLLEWAVLCRRNIAVSGGTGTGKTTLLNALSVLIPHTERIITIEDAAELRFGEHPHVVRLEARPANAEGNGAVSIRDLVINALRMRPDRIVVGECRGPEALDMLQAMNTGHDGSLTTLHANSPYEVINRLVMMARYAMDLPVAIIKQQIASALDLIVQLDRLSDGSRKISMLCGCAGKGEDVELETFVQWDASRKSYAWHCAPPWLKDARFASVIDPGEVGRWRRETGL